MTLMIFLAVFLLFSWWDPFSCRCCVSRLRSSLLMFVRILFAVVVSRQHSQC